MSNQIPDKRDLEDTIEQIAKDIKALDDSLKSQEQYISFHTELSSTDSLKRFVERLLLGLSYLEKQLPQLLDKQQASRKCRTDLKTLNEQLTSLKDNPSKIKEWSIQNDIFQKIIGLSDEALQCLYLAAQDLFHHKAFKESADALCLLTYINPKQPSLWLGYGHSEYCCQHYHAAAIAYTLASQLLPTNPKIYLHLANCYEATQQYKLAVDVLDKAIQAVHNSPEHASFKEHLMQYRQALATRI